MAHAYLTETHPSYWVPYESRPRARPPGAAYPACATLQRMLECREGSDLYILCGCKEIAVHRVVVWSQSPRLKDLSVAEKSQYGEVLSYTIDLTHENSRAVEVMVWFIYFNNYPHLEDSGDFGISDDSLFSLHVSVHNLAEKYEVPSLALLAKQHFIKAAKRHRDDFQRHIQKFPPFACDVLAALYSKSIPKPIPKPTPKPTSKPIPKPIPKPGQDYNGGSKAARDVAPVYVSVILDESGHRYDAALFQTNPRGIGNKYCHLLILDFHTEVYPKGRRYVTHLIYGMVGGPKTVEALGRISKGSLEEFDSATASISEAVGVFEAKFSHLTGLDWAYRSNQPVKSRFTYIGDGRNSLISGWSNAVSRPFLFDVSRTSASTHFQKDDSIGRPKAKPLPLQRNAEAVENARVAVKKLREGLGVNKIRSGKALDESRGSLEVR